jgi:hypothetical protein
MVSTHVPANRRSARAPGKGGLTMFSKILHANDGSDRAFKALVAAIDLAKRGGAELHMM